MHTDAFKDLPWQSQKVKAIDEFRSRPAPKIVEGVTAARMARVDPPCIDALVLLDGHDRTPRHAQFSQPGRHKLGESVVEWANQSLVPLYILGLDYV
jgi:hypothetical protein